MPGYQQAYELLRHGVHDYLLPEQDMKYIPEHDRFDRVERAASRSEDPEVALRDSKVRIAYETR